MDEDKYQTKFMKYAKGLIISGILIPFIVIIPLIGLINFNIDPTGFLCTIIHILCINIIHIGQHIKKILKVS
jgi:hypothetical protein